MTEYSYDPMDTDFLDDEQKQFFEDVEFIREREEPRRREYNESRPSRSYQREGIDQPDAVPLWWIEYRGRQALIETFADSDNDEFDVVEQVTLPRFNFFRVNRRSNHWF
jgi:hypothetical protein